MKPEIADEEWFSRDKVQRILNEAYEAGKADAQTEIEALKKRAEFCQAMLRDTIGIARNYSDMYEASLKSSEQP